MIVTRNNPIPTVRAIRVASFTGTIGVNTHLNDIAGPYGNVANVLAEMSYIGSSALRDNNAYSWSLPNYINLETHGIKLDIILTHNPGEEIAYGGLQSDISLLDQMAAACAGGLIGIEGLNEPQNFPDTWYGVPTSSWNTILQVQSAEYSAIEANSFLQHVPVLNASIDTWSFPGTAPNMAGVSDLGNAHVYPYSGNQPQFLFESILADQQSVVPGKPTWVTEFGYSTTPGDHTYGVDQTVQAKNILNGLFDAFADGVPMTFIYQLTDEQSSIPSDQAWGALGLFNADGSPKLAATALHNLTSIMSDPTAVATTFLPGSMALSVSGLPATGKYLLFEKSSGVFDLAIWNEATDWNAATGTDANVTPTTIKITTGAFVVNASLYDPMISTASISNFSRTSTFSVAVTDHPVILQFG